ncbi:hypothetical protein H311_02014 [Anncaliia algerae PRA109]|nr:hypothetical protein H311_02014 [Anncaliia algerae PRA109]
MESDKLEKQKLIIKYFKLDIKLCKRCNSKLKLEKNKDIYLLRCTWSICRTKISPFKDTIFENSKLDPLKIFNILKMWLDRISLKQICHNIGINKSTLSKFIKKAAKLAVPKYYKNFKPLGGKDIIIEADESKFGKRKYNKGHKVEGIWVLGMVERTIDRRIFLIAVDDRRANTLQKILSQNVTPDSILYTDCWRGYIGLGSNFAMHKTVNHSKGFKDYTSGVHTNTIEGNWAAVKAQISPRLRTKKLIPFYLLRFMLLRNEKNNAFIELIKLLI